MSKPTDKMIVVRHDADAGQWTASFEGVPQFAFGGATAVGAIRRLLEGAEAWRATYIECMLASEVPESVVWDPPELLVPSEDCNGAANTSGSRSWRNVRLCDLWRTVACSRVTMQSSATLKC
jgi:hypothetical protein